MKLITKIVLLLGISLFLVGCNEIQSEKEISSIAVDQNTLNENYDVESFDLSTIKLIISYDDGTTSTIDLSEEYLSNEDKTLLSSAGSHSITITYQGFTTTINISLINQISVFQQVYNLGVSSELIIDMTYEEWLESIRGEKGDQGEKGEPGTNGREVTFRVTSEYIQWSYDSSEWFNLISIDLLIGSKGDDGIDAKQVEFRVDNQNLQWKYVDMSSWQTLFNLSTLDGNDGADGITPHIGGNGNWFIGSNDTGIKALGTPGQNGLSPHIGENGNWFIGEVDTLVQAQGIQGEVGNGISAIALTKTEGLVDTYTITYTDGTTSTFTLTNGEDGKSAYQTYIENNPLYTKTESEWLEDLVNGRLATIEETKYTVTFNSDGGTLIDSQKVIKGEKATEPTIPIKEGYTFVGWFMGEEKWSFIGYSVTEDITLVAKWIEDIDFNIEGATLESNVYHLSVDNNVTSINFKQIVQSNQIWYLSKDINGTSINITKVGLLEIGNNTFYIIEEDGNDYNTYEINIRRLPMYTVTFITNSDAILESIEIQEGSLIGTIPTITKEGYVFDKWDYDFTIPVTSNITFSASWILIEYDIIYHLDGGINSVNNPDKYSNISNTIMLEDATKTGFTFLGWYSEETFISKVTKIEQGSTNDITLYARFAAETYTLHFVTNGGSEVSDITEEYGKEISVSTIKEGYIFVGWYKDSSLSLASYYELGSTMPAENLTLYAKWGMITYSIVYVMNEYTTNDASNPATYNVTSNISLIDPSVIGGTFIGWFTDEDYTNEIENISNMTGNITLYAKVEINQYTMTFVTNGGTEISPITQDYDTAIHVSTTKEGYMFAAWCSDEGLTTSIDISKMPNANLTVYAKWAQMYEYFTIDNMTYVYYGTYPQTVVDDSSLISSLNSLTSTNANGYYEFEGEEYAKVVAHPYETGFKFINGSTIQSHQTYYFKVEPIKWRVLEEADGTYTLLSEYIIDKQVFYTSRDNRTIGDQTIYANNYEHSTIREWLNNAFYNKAFSSPEKGSILTTLVDNSASTTESSTNPYFSNNTMDKVYLLSYQEARSSTYGFSTSTGSSSTRTAVTTDYARAVGAYMVTSTSYYGNGYWWLRSPHSSGSIFAPTVSDDGNFYNYISGVISSLIGARPAIKIG